MGTGRDDQRAARRRLRALGEEPLPAATRRRHLARLRGAPAPAGTAGEPPRRARTRVPRRLVPVLVAMLALLLVGGGGAVAAAQDATPDDALYGVKRTAEQVWVAMPRGEERAARLQLQLALRRHGEAARAPAHAEQLVAAGAQHAERAAEELPEEAFATFQRLLGDGEGSLPAEASPRASQAIHRNCVRLAERHGFEAGDCPEPRAGDHPGQGGPDRGPGERGGPGRSGEQPGWGPEGRPEGHRGPPPWAPGADRADLDDAGDADDTDTEDTEEE